MQAIIMNNSIDEADVFLFFTRIGIVTGNGGRRWLIRHETN